jgi:adenylosuccinate lyase
MDVMIERYEHPEMTPIWSETGRFEKLKDVECAVLRVMAKHKVVPLSDKDVDHLEKSFKIDLGKIKAHEKNTQHEILAFVAHWVDQCGPEGRWIHYGLTSSDVLDTALSLQIQSSLPILKKEFAKVLQAIESLIKNHGDNWILGRTHGVPAQPLKLSHKFALWGTHLAEAFEHFQYLTHNACQIKLSGAVGNYPIVSPEIEAESAKFLGLVPTSVATQVIGRHHHAALISQLAVVMGVIEKIAVDIRLHHQWGEICEGFSKKQMGSSAMPHKKNPIACENFTGMAKLLRGYTLMSLENIALWFERDISHSSVERVVFPDSFHIGAYTFKRLASVLSHLTINPKAMKDNLDSVQNVFYSQFINLSLLTKETNKTAAYKQVQQCAFEARETNTDFLKLVKQKLPDLDMSKLNLKVWEQHEQCPITAFKEVMNRVYQ